MADQEGRSASQFKASRWIGAGACALLLGLGLWVFGRSPPPAAPALKSAAVPPDVPPTAQSGLNPFESTARARRNAPAAGEKAGDVDICGVGKVTVDGNDPMAIAHYVQGLTEKTQARWSAGLLNSDNIRARAVGLFLQGMGDRKTEQTAAQSARDELVQLAVGADDPAIYALALFKCNTTYEVAGSLSGGCQAISWRGWARLEPDNAIPWLMVASVAHEANDMAAEADAFDHASKSQKIDSYNDSLFAFSESALPSDATPLERSFIGTEVMGVVVATSAPEYPIAWRHCSVGALPDGDVKRQCDALAKLMIDKGNNMITFSIGGAIGKRMGWPASRVDALEQERNAMFQSLQKQFDQFGDDDRWTCPGVKRLNDFFDLYSRFGQIALARELRERSGESVEELSRKWIESQEKTPAKTAEEQARAQEAPASDAH